MRHLYFAFAFLSLPASAAGMPVAPQDVTVVVGRSATEALEVSYALPAGCTHLEFVKAGAGAGKIRMRWQALNGGTAGADALTSNADGRMQLRFRVPLTTDKVTGYPGSFPVGEAVYSHMSNYAVREQCGPVRYRFLASGSIVTARARFNGVAPADADASALLFLRRQARREGLDYFDPALSAEAVRRIRDVGNETERVLRARMPGAHFKRPVIAAALAREPGGPNIGGSAGEILLLSLFNWPAVPDRNVTRLMIKLVAHEMSHRFQLRDAVDTYPDARLIHEGGAEFLRWTVSLQQGWLTPQQAGAELDDALAICMLATGTRSWRELAPSEIAAKHLEYNCGLPAFVYALAGRQGHGSAFGRIDAFYLALRGGRQPDFSTAMECGQTVCKPRMLPLLLSGSAPMREQWSRTLEISSLASPRAPTASQIDAMMLQAITTLVKEDCAGDSSITPTSETILIDALPACRTIRNDITVTQIEGAPVFGGGKALHLLIAACGARGEVALGLQEGSALTVPCGKPYQPMQHFYAADMRTIMERLSE